MFITPGIISAAAKLLKWKLWTPANSTIPQLTQFYASYTDRINFSLKKSTLHVCLYKEEEPYNELF